MQTGEEPGSKSDPSGGTLYLIKLEVLYHTFRHPQLGSAELPTSTGVLVLGALAGVFLMAGLVGTAERVGL
jgi:hypothetical protein